MAAASLLTVPYPYSVYPHPGGLNIGPPGKTTRQLRRVLAHYSRSGADCTNGGATDRKRGAENGTPNP